MIKLTNKKTLITNSIRNISSQNNISLLDLPTSTINGLFSESPVIKTIGHRKELVNLSLPKGSIFNLRKNCILTSSSNSISNQLSLVNSILFNKLIINKPISLIINDNQSIINLQLQKEWNILNWSKLIGWTGDLSINKKSIKGEGNLLINGDFKIDLKENEFIYLKSNELIAITNNLIESTEFDESYLKKLVKYLNNDFINKLYKKYDNPLVKINGPATIII